MHAGGDKEWGENKAAVYRDLNDNLIRKWRGQKIKIKKGQKKRKSEEKVIYIGPYNRAVGVTAVSKINSLPDWGSRPSSRRINTGSRVPSRGIVKSV